MNDRTPLLHAGTRAALPVHELTTTGNHQSGRKVGSCRCGEWASEWLADADDVRDAYNEHLAVAPASLFDIDLTEPT